MHWFAEAYWWTHLKTCDVSHAYRRLSLMANGSSNSLRSRKLICLFFGNSAFTELVSLIVTKMETQHCR